MTYNIRFGELAWLEELASHIEVVSIPISLRCRK